MRKVLLSLVTASSLLVTGTYAEASTYTTNSNVTVSSDWTSTNVESTYTYKEVQQVSSSKATAKSGSFKTTYNTNVRADAGTKNKIVTSAKKGSTVTATHQKKVGKETWYKVNVNGKSGWLLSTLVTPVAAQATKAKAPAKSTVTQVSAGKSNSSSVINNALKLRGIPYRFGGTTTRGFDCSGFIQYVFKQSGKSISRNTLTQFAETKTVSSPQPGDLVFFKNTYRPGISHVGIYIGNNQFVHAGGKKAEVKSLSDSYWKTKFHSFKR